MKYTLYIMLILLIVACANNQEEKEIPEIESSHRQKTIQNLGIAVGLTDNEELNNFFSKSDKVIRVKPGVLVDENAPLEYRIYHVTGNSKSTFVTVKNTTHEIDTFSYNANILELKRIYLHSSSSGKNGLVVSFEDKQKRIDSLISVIHSLEINKSGKIEISSIAEAFDGTIQLKTSFNTHSGKYDGERDKIKINLTLKDGSDKTHYYGLMKIRTPENCTLSYRIENKDLSSNRYDFDELGIIHLEIINNQLLMNNLEHDLCDEKNTTFNIKLIKGD